MCIGRDAHRDDDGDRMKGSTIGSSIGDPLRQPPRRSTSCPFRHSSRTKTAKGRSWREQKANGVASSFGELHQLDDFEIHLLNLQSRIVAEAEAMDCSGKRFCEDRWDRDVGSGFGVTRVLENGNVMEKAAVNVSIIRGHLTPERAKTMRSRGRDVDASRPTGEAGR